MLQRDLLHISLSFVYPLRKYFRKEHISSLFLQSVFLSEILSVYTVRQNQLSGQTVQVNTQRKIQNCFRNPVHHIYCLTAARKIRLFYSSQKVPCQYFQRHSNLQCARPQHCQFRETFLYRLKELWLH